MSGGLEHTLRCQGPTAAKYVKARQSENIEMDENIKMGEKHQNW